MSILDPPVSDSHCASVDYASYVCELADRERPESILDLSRAHLKHARVMDGTEISNSDCPASCIHGMLLRTCGSAVGSSEKEFLGPPVCGPGEKIPNCSHWTYYASVGSNDGCQTPPSPRKNTAHPGSVGNEFCEPPSKEQKNAVHPEKIHTRLAGVQKDDLEPRGGDQSCSKDQMPGYGIRDESFQGGEVVSECVDSFIGVNSVNGALPVKKSAFVGVEGPSGPPPSQTAFVFGPEKSWCTYSYPHRKVQGKF